MTTTDPNIRHDLHRPDYLVLPEGVTKAEAAERIRPWVPIDLCDELKLKRGARIRVEYQIGSSEQDARWVHPDDVPTDPEADLIEDMARALFERDAIDTGAPVKHYDLPAVHDSYVANARAALAVVREHEAKR